MSQLCSIRHDIPVILHTPEAYGSNKLIKIVIFFYVKSKFRESQ